MQAARSVVITAGPGHAPIDAVRRITNQSTGRLGAVLANHFAAQGWRVLLLRGELATDAMPLSEGIDVTSFGTLEECAAALEKIARAGETVDAVLHAAALPDFEVMSVQTAEDKLPVHASKIDSRAGDLLLRLTPAPKVIERLRDWFPKSWLVGWKYEIGAAENFPQAQAQLLGKARTQLAQAGTDWCVVNAFQHSGIRSLEFT